MFLQRLPDLVVLIIPQEETMKNATGNPISRSLTFSSSWDWLFTP